MFYCSSVWPSTTKKTIARFQVVQNFAAKLATNTKHRNKLNVPLFRAATGQWSFVYRTTRPWNELPRTLTDVNSNSEISRLGEFIVS